MSTAGIHPVSDAVVLPDRAVRIRQAVIRLAALAALFIAELVAISMWLDGASITAQTGALAGVRILGPWVLRGVVGFTAAFLAFAVMGYREALAGVVEKVAIPFRWRLLVTHTGSLVVFLALARPLYEQRASSGAVVALWVAIGLIAIGSAALAFFPPPFWAGLLRATGTVWIYAAVVTVLALVAWSVSQSLWRSAAGLTFEIVRAILRPLIPDLTADPAALRLSGHRFAVTINEQCSGLEGASLILVFGAVWLWLSRKEMRFPQSFLLLPAGVVMLYLLNAVRIAALLLIGDAGAVEIAKGGFHSQAGWIAFNGVAFGLAVVARRLPWFSLHPPRREPAALAAHNPTAAYLVPFLAILAAGMLSGSMTGAFEWAYPLRLIAAGAALWAFRRVYRDLDWRCGWMGAAAGVAVYLLWIGFGRGLPAQSMPAALAGAAGLPATLWIICRALAATVTVPVAEELAFRGFLLRRLVSADFEAVALRSVGWLAIVLSSVAFGLMHGGQWMEGTLAGILFAWVARRRNRIGEAVLAHAVANALLAVTVLLGGAWQFW